jgi:hypothetical protein
VSAAQLQQQQATPVLDLALSQQLSPPPPQPSPHSSYNLSLSPSATALGGSASASAAAAAAAGAGGRAGSAARSRPSITASPSVHVVLPQHTLWAPLHLVQQLTLQQLGAGAADPRLAAAIMRTHAAASANPASGPTGAAAVAGGATTAAAAAAAASGSFTAAEFETVQLLSSGEAALLPSKTDILAASAEEISELVRVGSPLAVIWILRYVSATGGSVEDLPGLLAVARRARERIEVEQHALFEFLGAAETLLPVRTNSLAACRQIVSVLGFDAVLCVRSAAERKAANKAGTVLELIRLLLEQQQLMATKAIFAPAGLIGPVDKPVSHTAFLTSKSVKEEALALMYDRIAAEEEAREADGVRDRDQDGGGNQGDGGGLGDGGQGGDAWESLGDEAASAAAQSAAAPLAESPVLPGSNRLRAAIDLNNLPPESQKD